MMASVHGGNENDADAAASASGGGGGGGGGEDPVPMAVTMKQQYRGLRASSSSSSSIASKSSTTMNSSSLGAQPTQAQERTPVESFNRPVGDYMLKETIGRGAFGKVKLAVHRHTGDYYAIKMLPALERWKASTTKEINILKGLHHQHVIKYIKDVSDSDYTYIIMEHSPGGELFDKIVPDVGMHDEYAHFFFHQLIDTVTYLHFRGVCHRDLKPENILLDEYGNMKLADFGCSTVFKFRGEERLLTERVGSPPYAAPEILAPPYKAEPVDIWSCGVILFVMLLGNTPWDEPTDRSLEFKSFKRGVCFDTDPWNRLPGPALDLMRGMLRLDPKERYTLDDVKRDPWFMAPNDLIVLQRQNAKLNRPPTRVWDSLPTPASAASTTSSTQPTTYYDLRQLDTSNYNPRQAFSQPTQNMVDSPAMTQTPSVLSNSVSIIGQRLRRFFSYQTPMAILKRLSAALTKLKHPNHQAHYAAARLTFLTYDKRRCPLRGAIHVEKTPEISIVYFRRTQGDPVEFRRLFIKLTSELRDIIVEPENNQSWMPE